MVTMTTLSCPNCSAKLKTECAKQRAVCAYCGSEVLLMVPEPPPVIRTNGPGLGLDRAASELAIQRLLPQRNLICKRIAEAQQMVEQRRRLVAAVPRLRRGLVYITMGALLGLLAIPALVEGAAPDAVRIFGAFLSFFALILFAAARSARSTSRKAANEVLAEIGGLDQRLSAYPPLARMTQDLTDVNKQLQAHQEIVKVPS